MRYTMVFVCLLLLLSACSPQAQQTDVMVTPTEVITPTPTPVPTTPPIAPTPTEIPEPTPTEAPAEIDYYTVKPNEVGNIMIIMYHGLAVENPGGYDRKTEEFIKDLQRFYDQGYRLISMRDMIDNHITVAAGYTPLVLTFDDGKSSAFSLIEQDGELVPSPGCAVDILNNFTAEHPDFGKAAAFYINGDAEPFRGAGTLEQRLQYLLDNGYEIGNHTYSHAYLNKLDAQQIQDEIGFIDQLIRNTTGFIPDSLAYPFGIRPVEALRPVALDGVYQGQPYHYAWGLREGQSTVTACPNHVKFDATNVPRVRGTDDSTPTSEVQDLGFWIRYYEQYPERRYISDGNPQRIAVPKGSENLVNLENYAHLELYVY